MANTKTIDTAIAAKKKVTDGASIPIIQTDGTLAQIAKADLAKVLGGLIPIGVLQTVDSYNDAKTTGLYVCPTSEGQPGKGIMAVFAYAKNVIGQIFIRYDGALFTRVYWYSSWSAWKLMTSN